MKTFQSTMNYNKAKDAKNLENFNRNQYNQSVTESHNYRAADFLANKEMHEAKIRQLEEIEQRMVSDLQRTLQRKNQAITDLQEKSKGLKRVMQPRKAYKYGPRAQSNENLHAHVQSHYSFTNSSGFRNNLADTQNSKINGIYGKRANSISTGVAPPSGNEINMVGSPKKVPPKNDTNESMFVA